MLHQYFIYPYIPISLPYGSDSILRKLRLSENGYIGSVVIKKLIGNLFVFADYIKPGDIFEAVLVTINMPGERLLGYCSVLSVADNNLVLSDNFRSKNEAQIAYTLATKMRDSE